MISLPTRWLTAVSICMVAYGVNGLLIGTTRAQDEAQLQAEVQQHSAALSAAFNAGKAAEVAAMFVAAGEVIDEQGNLYKGREQIKELLQAFFDKFPGVKLENQIDSIRFVGPVAIQEGKRITATADGSTATIGYIGVLVKSEQGWLIASLRDFPEEYPPTPGEMLQVLDWLVGDWVNEGADGRVKLSFRWSEDGNFILGEIEVTDEAQQVAKSSQRIAWDPLQRAPRSWLFDSDGGFAEWHWVAVDNTWFIRSSATLPDGQLGSAIVKIVPGEGGRYTMSGTQRLVGNSLLDDYEIVVVKRPPSPAKQPAVDK